MTIKIALCMSGHMRSYKDCLDNLKEHILSRFDTDIFIHTWNKGPNYDLFTDEITNAQEIIDLYKQAGAKNVEIVIEKVNVMKKIPNIANNKIYKYWEINNTICHRQLIYQHYKINQVHKMRQNFEKANNITYDIVCRIRPDLLFIDKIDITITDYITMFLVKNPCWMCVHEDIFWFGPPNLMDNLSEMFNHLGTMYELNNNMMVHNHYLLYFYLTHWNIKYQDKYSKFDIKRHPNYQDTIPMIVTDYEEQ